LKKLNKKIEIGIEMVQMFICVDKIYAKFALEKGYLDILIKDLAFFLDLIKYLAN